MMQPPQIDGRDSRDLVRQLRKLLPRYIPDWPQTTEERQLSEAMIHVFAHYGEILIDRMNRAPQKNLLAFLQTLGIANLPPQPARVPLTFYLAGEGADYAVVPARTQVAAQLLKGEKDPVVFETDRELVVVSTRLASLFARDGGHDRYSDLTQLVPQLSPAPGAVMAAPMLGTPLFSCDTPIPHHFYVGIDVMSPSPMIDRLVYRFEMGESSFADVSASIEWELFMLPGNPATVNLVEEIDTEKTPLESLLAKASSLRPTEDTTDGLTKSGEVIFQNVPLQTKDAPQRAQQLWLMCRLLTAITTPTVGETGQSNVRLLTPNDLPVIVKVSAALEIDQKNVPIKQAFFNNLRLDLTKDFYPFGERPKFGDTLYLASSELFSSPNSGVTLRIVVRNPAGETDPGTLPSATPHGVRLVWDFWDGIEWSYLGVSDDTDQIRIYGPGEQQGPPVPFRDRTKTFSSEGEASFKLPKQPVPTAVNGVTDFWIRVRIIAGNYGREAHLEQELIHNVAIAASYAPPVIASIKADYRFRQDVPAGALVTYNDFRYHQLLGSNSTGDSLTGMRPFETATENLSPTVCFGFDLPLSMKDKRTPQGIPATFPPRSMSIYLDVQQSTNGISSENHVSTSDAIRWEYWNGYNWLRWTVRDETRGFREPGLIRFLAPQDFVACSHFGVMRHWLRAVPDNTDYQPMIRVALLNTTMGSGGYTIANELLGISNGLPEQSFQLLHPPVLEGQRLEILEPRIPGRLEQQAIRRLEGDDAIQAGSEIPNDAAVWLRWHQVSDFFASSHKDRHYVLDALAGKVSFGDGINGHIPPRGGKVRASAYRTGGGAVGNRPAGNITQMKTAIPYIDKVYNWTVAAGGGDAEGNDALLDRGTRGLRHGGRAVTVQDYEDLACLASSQVARSKCVPLKDLAAPVLSKYRQTGVVSVIVVPRSNDPRPMPEAGLLTCVLEHLLRSAPSTVQISVVGPEYIRMDVTIEIVIDEPDRASEIELGIQLAIQAFLHPLNGAQDGCGWPFGRMPNKSDFYLLMKGMTGVKYVRDVRLFAISDRSNLQHTDRFLVSLGTISVEASLSPNVAGGAACH